MKKTVPFSSIRLFAAAGFAALVLLSLSGCDTVPKFGGSGPIYKPLDSDLAAMMQPADPSAKPLYCMIAAGQAHFGKTWQSFSPSSFTLTQKSRTNLALTGGSNSLPLQAIFDSDGQKLVFCPIVNGPPDAQISCASFYALDDDYDLGIRRTFELPEVVTGAYVTCAYDKQNLKPQ